MTSARALAGLAVGATVFALAASCSSSPVVTAAPPDSALVVEASLPPEAGPTETGPAPDAADASARCGPLDTVDVEVRRDGVFRGVELTTTVADVTMVDACQGTSKTLRHDATRPQFSPADGADFYFRVDPVAPKEGYYSSTSEIWNFEFPGIRAEFLVPLIPRGANADPDVVGSPIADVFANTYDPTRAHFALQIEADGACSAAGYRPTVVGHPEARAAYSTGPFAVDPDTDMTVTTERAFVFVSGVTAGAGSVTFEGRTPGCKLVPQILLVPVNTGKYPLVAGTVTLVQLLSTHE